MVGGMQAVAFNAVNDIPAVVAATVEFRGVQVGHEGQAGKAAGDGGGGVGHPVMGMDDIGLLLGVFFEHYSGGGSGEAVHLVHEVVLVAAMEVADLGDVVAVEGVGIHALGVIVAVGVQAGIHRTHEQFGEFIVVLLMAHTLHSLLEGMGDGYAGSGAKFGFGLASLFFLHAGQNEGEVNALFRKALGDAEAGSTEATADMRREFPSKHQNTHIYSPVVSGR